MSSQHHGQFHVWHIHTHTALSTNERNESKSGCAAHICIDVVYTQIFGDTKKLPRQREQRQYSVVYLTFFLCKTICFRLQANVNLYIQTYKLCSV